MTGEQKKRIQKLQSEGMGYSKIAGLLGLSPNTVKAFLYRKNEKPAAPVCEICGRPMVGNRPNQRFCSAVCRNRWWATERKRNPSFASVCPVCGTEIKLRYKDEKTFCSRSCAAKARERKEADRD